MMLFGMPMWTFLAFLSWPVIFITSAIVIYIVMSKQDALIDDSEFEKGIKSRKGEGHS
ncbi:hypothetical protein [Clostridium aminobutyricum]|uniref:Uncharacterized protein n=1 Tax=Clostridium aminobutyricum TaxID=33953 RepID=A0A939DAS7_CLOAM|nr:hypothetical protein [Clostridium aminobutyricum]MBN7774392.1 hypothetical protein [Clostridium aminobutyricum]